MTYRRTQRRPSNYETDPSLKTEAWRRVRAHWIARREPCARCGRDIDYDTPVRTWRSLDVGHVVDRVTARALGWTVAEINDLSNTQPEHQRCNREAGVILGNRRRRPGAARGVRPIEADEW